MKTFKEFVEEYTFTFEDFMTERVWRSTNWGARTAPRLILPGSELRDPAVPVMIHPREPRETRKIEDLPINKRRRKNDKKNRNNIR